MRLRLAQMMYQDLNFLILDEPTNHLDIESLDVLEEALEEFNGTLLAVSHDRYFLDKLFEKIYWIDGGCLYGFQGNYQWARQKLQEHKQKQEKQHHDTPGTAKKVRVSDTVKKASKKSTVTIEDIECHIEEIESSIRALDKRLQETKMLDALQQYYAEKEGLENRREALYQQLEELL